MNEALQRAVRAMRHEFARQAADGNAFGHGSPRICTPSIWTPAHSLWRVTE